MVRHIPDEACRDLVDQSLVNYVKGFMETQEKKKPRHAKPSGGGSAAHQARARADQKYGHGQQVPKMSGRARNRGRERGGDAPRDQGEHNNKDPEIHPRQPKREKRDNTRASRARHEVAAEEEVGRLAQKYEGKQTRPERLKDARADILRLQREQGKLDSTRPDSGGQAAQTGSAAGVRTRKARGKCTFVKSRIGGTIEYHQVCS